MRGTTAKGATRLFNTTRTKSSGQPTCTKCWRFSTFGKSWDKPCGGSKQQPSPSQIAAWHRIGQHNQKQLSIAWQTTLANAKLNFTKLVEQGIGPNPGPTHGFTIISINVGGGAGLWRTLQVWKPDTILRVQEAGIRPNEWEAFQR